MNASARALSLSLLLLLGLGRSSPADAARPRNGSLDVGRLKPNTMKTVVTQMEKILGLAPGAGKIQVTQTQLDQAVTRGMTGGRYRSAVVTAKVPYGSGHRLEQFLLQQPSRGGKPSVRRLSVLDQTLDFRRPEDRQVVAQDVYPAPTGPSLTMLRVLGPVARRDRRGVVGHSRLGELSYLIVGSQKAPGGFATTTKVKVNGTRVQVTQQSPLFD